MPSTALANSAPKISLNAIPLPDSRTRAAIFLIFIASLLDFSLTCHYVSLGAREMNPVLAPLFHAGRFMEVFWLKTFMTAAGVSVFALFPQRPLVRIALPSLVAVYFGVIFYHIIHL
ncbi:MAG: DUF5658 family protein [Deltaproteobacteria bacterium]